MDLTLLKGKLHRATVTNVNLEYEGSVAIAEDLMEAANILPFEQVDIYNITNGERLTTYAIKAPRGSGTISVQGAAAHKARQGDLVIIAAYARMSEVEAVHYNPPTVLLGVGNTMKDSGVRVQDSGEREQRAEGTLPLPSLAGGDREGGTSRVSTANMPPPLSPPVNRGGGASPEQGASPDSRLPTPDSPRGAHHG